MGFKGLSRKGAFILYGVVLVVFLIIGLLVPFYQAMYWGILSVVLTIATIGFMVDWPYCCCCFKNNNDDEDDGALIVESNNPIMHNGNENNGPSHDIHITSKAEQDEHDRRSQLSVNRVENQESLIKPKKKRVYYLDNIKSILTCIVVIHHITCAFSGNGWFYMLGHYYNPFIPFGSTILALNQSYFMCLFFFISGYFTPISYKKKGRYKFLKDKFKRLGIPLLVFLYILGPLNDFFVSTYFILNMDGNPRGTYSYFPDPGPCWFLAWLLILNSCYCIMDQNIDYYVKDIPVFWKITLYAIVLGILQAIVIVMVPAGFFFMPITTGSLPFDLLFFTSGTIAKKNEWLKKLTQDGSYRYIILTILCGLVTIGFYITIYIYDYGQPFMPDKHEHPHNCDDDSSDLSGTTLVAYFGVVIWFGICCMFISLGWIQFGGLYLDFTNDITKFFSGAAYTVYIIHPLVVCPITYTWTLIVYKINGVKFLFCDDSHASKIHFGANYLVWMGWLYTVVISLLILWPLAHYIRKLPVLNKIL